MMACTSMTCHQPSLLFFLQYEWPAAGWEEWLKGTEQGHLDVKNGSWLVRAGRSSVLKCGHSALCQEGKVYTKLFEAMALTDWQVHTGLRLCTARHCSILLLRQTVTHSKLTIQSPVCHWLRTGHRFKIILLIKCFPNKVWRKKWSCK